MWTISSGIMALCIQMIMADLGYKKSDSKIVGGFEMNLEHAPFLVSIQIHRSHICGGAILTLSHAISGCHCLSDVDMGMPHNQVRLRPISDYRIVAGTENLAHPTHEMQQRAISDAKIHPNCSYESVLQFDFALVFLREPLEETAKVRPFTLVSIDNKAFDLETTNLAENRGCSCYVAGWGTTVSGPREAQVASPVLKAVRMVVITDVECGNMLGRQNTKYMNYNFTKHGQLCSLAYGHRKNASDCNGDSGGPFFCNSRVYGIVSYGFKCGQWDVPNVYAKLSFAIDWLMSFHLKERLRTSEELPLLRAKQSSRAATTKGTQELGLLLITLLQQLMPTLDTNMKISANLK